MYLAGASAISWIRLPVGRIHSCNPDGNYFGTQLASRLNVGVKYILSLFLCTSVRVPVPSLAYLKKVTCDVTANYNSPNVRLYCNLMI